MKQQALALVSNINNPNDKLNLLREYIQGFVLRSLHESEAFNCLSFVGGTALRFLYNLPRFSEDLDFSLESNKNYDPEKWLAKLKRDLEFAQFEATLTWSTKTTVHNGWIKIKGLLKETGLSGHADQAISIKWEIDTHPPAGAKTETQVVNRHFLLALRHHDLPSLMAGKIHALGCRTYIKGRDYYDLLWYRSRRPPVIPNLILLQNALDQTEKDPWQAGQWKKILLNKLSTTDFKTVAKDVEPFLEHPKEAELLTQEHLIQCLKG